MEKRAFLTSHQTLSNMFPLNLIRCHISIWLIKCVNHIMRFPSNVWLFKSSVSNKDNETPTAILKNKERWQTQSKVIPYFHSFLFLKISKCDVGKKEPYFYENTSFTPNGHLLGVFFFSCGLFDQWSTSWFCWSLLVFVVGFAGKAPLFHRSGQSRAKRSHAQELAK